MISVENISFVNCPPYGWWGCYESMFCIIQILNSVWYIIKWLRQFLFHNSSSAKLTCQLSVSSLSSCAIYCFLRRIAYWHVSYFCMEWTWTVLNPACSVSHICVCCVLQACEDGVTPAVRSVKFYGVLYDRDLLTATQEVEKASAQASWWAWLLCLGIYAMNFNSCMLVS